MLQQQYHQLKDQLLHQPPQDLLEEYLAKVTKFRPHQRSAEAPKELLGPWVKLLQKMEGVARKTEVLAYMK
jgi:hypothetical protein